MFNVSDIRRYSHSIVLNCIDFQLTYSTTRFAIYETMKKRIVEPGQNLLFYQKVLLAGVSGFVGGVVGTPADMINVR